MQNKMNKTSGEKKKEIKNIFGMSRVKISPCLLIDFQTCFISTWNMGLEKNPSQETQMPSFCWVWHRQQAGMLTFALVTNQQVMRLLVGVYLYFFFIFVWECVCFSASNIYLMHCVSQQNKLPCFPSIECFIASCSRGFSGTQRSPANTPLAVVSYKCVGWSGGKSSWFWSQDSLLMLNTKIDVDNKDSVRRRLPLPSLRVKSFLEMWIACGVSGKS